MHSITLQTSSGVVTDGMVLGRLGFAASSEEDTGIADDVAAKLEAVAEKTFEDDKNATEFVFSLAADGTVASKMTLSSAGLLTPAGGIACDSMVVDTAAAGLDIVFGGVTTTNKMTLTNNLPDALNITEGSNSYIKFVTTDDAEQIVVSKTIYSAPSADITIKAEGSMIFQVDANAATQEEFSWLKGDGSERMNLTEGGDLKLPNGELQTGGIAYRDGDRAITIADGGKVTFSQAVVGAVVAGGTSGTIALDCSTSNYFTITTSSDVDGLNFTNAVVGQRIIVRITNGGTDTIAFGTDTIKWPGGTAPVLTTPTGTDVYGFICTTESSAFDGFIIGQALA